MGASLPQLQSEDVLRLDTALRDLIDRTSATAALMLDRAGFRIACQGRTDGLDITTLGALSANTYAASAAMAGLLGDPAFSSVYQEGRTCSLLIQAVDECALLVVLFAAGSGGAVKYFSGITSKTLTSHLQTASHRAPEATLDLAVLNVADTTEIFRRKACPFQP